MKELHLYFIILVLLVIIGYKCIIIKLIISMKFFLIICENICLKKLLLLMFVL